MHEVYRFGAFELDATVLRLYRDGMAVEGIEPRPLEVLAELLRNAGQVVTKNDLMEKVWIDRVVTESAITRCVNRLRGVLDDQDHTLILTVHGYGYRYTGKVQCVTQATGTQPAPVALPAIGEAIPGRPQWRLARVLDERACVWLARHRKTAEQRVFKFAPAPERLTALKRELTIHRLLQRSLPDREDYARLLDCNLETPPFFLELEYCGHGSLADWLAAQGGVDQVALETRLDLVAQAAEALAAAHAIGVLHLDVKPSNLLIWISQDGRPRIRWTDFGSGRLLEPDRLALLEITRLGMTHTQAAGGDGTTPLYTAPEVVAGQKPTALSDIYALGVVLYQLVSGDLRRPMAPGWEQEIADELLCEDIAAAAHGNPERRLASAAELASRLRTLSARREAREHERSAMERAQRMQEQLERDRTRRPWIVAAGTMLGIGLLISQYYYRDALQARDTAREQAAIAEAVTNFFNEDILGAASPYQLEHDGDMTVHEAVARATARLEGRFPEQPATEAAIHMRLAALDIQFARLAAARDHLQKAAELYAAARGSEHAETLNARYLLVATLSFNSEFEEAGKVLDALDATLARSPRLQHELPGLRDRLRATYHRQRQQYARVVPHSEGVLATQLQRSPDDVMSVSMRRHMLGLDYARVGRFADAHEQFTQVFAMLASNEDPHNSLTAMARNSQGTALFLEQRFAEARDTLADAHRTFEKSVGRHGEYAAESLTYLCLAQTRLGEAAQAVVRCRDAHNLYREHFGTDSHFTLIAQGHLGIAALAAGQIDVASANLAPARERLARMLGPRAPSPQLFGYFLAQARLHAADGAVDVEALLSELDAASLQGAWPKENWPAKLDLLRARLLLVRGDRVNGNRLLASARDELRRTTPADADVGAAERLLAASEKP